MNQTTIKSPELDRSLTFQDKYDAIGKKGSEYEGVFITAVKTTGIFCRPSCTARKPRIENVMFYDEAQEAIKNGFRPCKVCKPMEKKDETPAYIKKIIAELQEDPCLKLKDHDLRQRSIEPSHIRRWFKKHHNITFHAYQRMIRINKAFQNISRGEKIINSAYDSGFDSLSAFNESYRSIFGSSATHFKDKNIINIERITTPLGPMFACATKKGLCLLDFTDRKMLETEFKDLSKRLNAVILPGKNPWLSQIQSELSEYFLGKRKKFEIALDTPGTEFQQSVWKILKKIPYGKTWSYKEQSINLNKPKAIRAVATANGCNRVSIVIPCHRVIGSDGSLVGYGGGLHRKKWLLDFERQYI